MNGGARGARRRDSQGLCGAFGQRTKAAARKIGRRGPNRAKATGRVAAAIAAAVTQKFPKGWLAATASSEFLGSIPKTSSGKLRREKPPCFIWRTLSAKKAPSLAADRPARRFWHPAQPVSRRWQTAGVAVWKFFTVYLLRCLSLGSFLLGSAFFSAINALRGVTRDFAKEKIYFHTQPSVTPQRVDR